MKEYHFKIREDGIGTAYIKVLDTLLAEIKKKEMIEECK